MAWSESPSTVDRHDGGGWSGVWQGCSGVGNPSRTDGSRDPDPRQHEEAGMALFRRKPEFDEELESRVGRLQSECRQAKLHSESLPGGAEKQNRLKDLEAAEQAITEARAGGDKEARIRAALRAEAELCLTKPVPLLVPTAHRLREKLYRLDSKRREAWEKYLDRLTWDGDALDQQSRGGPSVSLEESYLRVDRSGRAP